MNSRTVHASGTSATARLLTTIRSRLLDPPVLVIIAVVFLISAVGQAILQAYFGDNSAVNHYRAECSRIVVPSYGNHHRCPTPRPD
jgi:hypothetical protein